VKPAASPHSTRSSLSAATLILVSSAIAAVVTVVLAVAAGVHFWFPEQASTVAHSVDLVFNIITWISIFFFVLIVILMGYFMVKYRRLEPTTRATSNVTHNTPLELTWTIIPLILVIGIFYAGMMGYLNLRHSPLGAYEVQVDAQRWSWNFSHRNGCSEPNILRVPVGRPVKLLMQSSDVLHAAYIPAFRVKQDIVPGRITTLWFECNKPGTYDLFCAEYCGKDHSQMHALVIAYEQQEFEAMLQECADWAKNTPDEALYTKVPQRIFPRCASCHSLDGKSGTGPTWRGVWHEIETGNIVFTDGTKLADLMGPGKMFASPEDYIRRSILNPQEKVVMNFSGAMPTFQGQLKDREIMAVIEFIKRLDEFDDAGKPKPGTQAERLGKSTS
jgi:cytochrome c oxidase subunit 2